MHHHNQPVRLFLHIGLPKTGTSYIQSFFDTHRDSLITRNYLYPSTGLDGSGHRLLSFPFLSEERRALPDVKPYLTGDELRLWHRLRDEIAEAGTSNIVMSSEYFTEVMTPKCLREICDLLSLDVVVIIYLRRQDRFIEAGYNQAVKAGLESRRFALDINYSPIYDFEVLLDRWEEAFGFNALVVRTFEQAITGDGLLQDFLKIVSLDYPTEHDAGFRNQGLHSGLLEFRRIENAIGLTESQLAVLASKRLSAIHASTNYEMTNPEDRDRFLAYYEASNTRVAKRYFGNEKGHLFEPPTAPTSISPIIDPETCLSVILSAAYNELISEISSLKQNLDVLQKEVTGLREEIGVFHKAPTELHEEIGRTKSLWLRHLKLWRQFF